MESLKTFLNNKYRQYDQISFIKEDPISIPHQFTKKQDREIAGFFAALFAWGNRKMIIQKSMDLMQRMDFSPLDFCINHVDNDLKKLIGFKHRTFNDTDLLYLVAFLKMHYKKNESLESAFTLNQPTGKIDIKTSLVNFHHYVFSMDDFPEHTKKHIANPEKNSTCKRLNMFLRWMVRKDKYGVDFGIWESIATSQLICPIDLHVAKVANKLRLLNRKQLDWSAAKELTNYLKLLDPKDPVKYDFALFGLGVVEKYY